MDVPRKLFYVKLPFVSHESNRNIRFEVNKLVREFYPQLKVALIFQNFFTVGSFFKFKDRIPEMLRGNVIYKFQCAQCDATYCGETTRHLQTRVAEHQGVSSRTGSRLTNPRSQIFEHYFSSGHRISPDSFNILKQEAPNRIKISESILIKVHNPTLNSMESSLPLNIV